MRRTIAAASSSESSWAVVSSTCDPALRPIDERVELGLRSPAARRRAPSSASSRTKLRTSGSAPSVTCRARSPWRPGRSAGWRGTPRSSGVASSASTSARARRARRRPCPAPAPPRTARARRCAARRPLCSSSRPLLEGREVEPLDASSISRRWSSVSSTLPTTRCGRLDGEVGDLGADLVDRARRLGLDLLARVLEPPLALGLGLLLGARAAARRPPCAPRRGSRPTRFAPARARPGSARAARAPRCGRCRPPRPPGGCGRAARRSSSGSGRTRTCAARRTRSRSRSASRS